MLVDQIQTWSRDQCLRALDQADPVDFMKHNGIAWHLDRAVMRALATRLQELGQEQDEREARLKKALKDLLVIALNRGEKLGLDGGGPVLDNARRVLGEPVFDYGDGTGGYGALDDDPGRFLSIKAYSRQKRNP